MKHSVLDAPGGLTIFEARRIKINVGKPLASDEFTKSCAVSSNVNCLQTFSQNFTVAAPITTPIAFQNLDDDHNGIGIDNVILLTQAAPTASQVTVGGRAISSATVTKADASGKIRKTKSAPFGDFRFANVAAGETYVFTASAKKYVFNESAQVFNINEEIDSINFVAGERSKIKKSTSAR